MIKVYAVMDTTESELGEVFRIFDNEAAAIEMVKYMTSRPDNYGEFEVQEYDLWSAFDADKYEKGE